MKRIAIFVTLFAAFLGAALAQSIGERTALLYKPPVSTFYVSNGGSDSNDGKTAGTAWQTIAHVNALTFAAGSTILFNGGQTFSGQLAFTATNAPHGMPLVGSYGTGLAIIAGTGSGCITVDSAVTNVTVPNAYCGIGPNIWDVGTAFAATTTTSMHPTFAIPAGATIVIQGFNQTTNATSGTITDTQGNTYTQLTAAVRNNVAANGKNTMFVCQNCKALSTSDTITYTDATSTVLFFDASYVTGLVPGSSPLDPASTTVVTGANGQPSITCNAPSVAGEMLIANLQGLTINPTLKPLVPQWFLVFPIWGNIAAGGLLNYGTNQQTMSPQWTNNGPWGGQCIGLKLGMQPVLINVYNAGGTSPLVSPMQSAIPAGSLIIFDAFTTNASTASTTLSDSKGNTWTKITSVAPNGNTANGNEIWWYSFNSTALTTSDTITMTDPGAGLAVTIAWTSYIQGASNPLDSGVTTTATGTGTTPSVTCGTPAALGEIIYGSLGIVTQPTRPITGFTTYNLQTNLGETVNTALTGPTFAPTGGSGDWAVLCTGFKK